MTFDHTDEQLDIISAAASTKANCMIDALAGTGKTSTLEAVERAVRKQPILYLVFNKKNSVEAEARMLSTTTVRTFNSIGHRIWAASICRNLSLDSSKTYKIFKEIADAAPRSAQPAIWTTYAEVAGGVGLAKALGYIPADSYPNAKRLITQSRFQSHLDEIPDELASDLIDEILLRSIKLAYEGQIDYDDQVYMPALFGGVFPKFPLVLVDEYQDLSPVNHQLLERLIGRVNPGRLIGVGDPWQNIYGFRGAKAGGMTQAVEQYTCSRFPLSVSFRCPSEIVKAVHWRVPQFKWSTEGGHVEAPTTLPVTDIGDGTTIICRNNAPLLRCGFNLLGAGRSISVAGSDIGPRLVKALTKLGADSMSQAQTLTAIDSWEADKLEKESKSAADMAACMRIFASKSPTLSGAIAYAEHLFKQSGSILLTTGHKAKGLEWSTVIHLDPWLVRRGTPGEQEQNLDYVISTRSCHTLIEINSEQIEW